jgi:putative transposase
VRFAFIKDHEGEHPVAFMCKLLSVSTSGFYAWAGRPPSRREREDERIKLEIRAIHRKSRGTYGSPRVLLDLRARGRRVGRNRVARIMREDGRVGRHRHRWKRTTLSNHRLGYSPNLLANDFSAEAPNTVWVGDITYIRTWEGWLYLASLLDLYSRRVVGFALDDTMPAELPLEALRMARRNRQPPPGLIHHSDRGSQYASNAYRAELASMGAIQSMTKGSCYENAVAESFFSTLKTELIHRYAWPTKEAAAKAVTDYINDFYNPVRRHSSAGNLSPIEHELCFMRAAVAA